MRSDLLAHALNREFPALNEIIGELKLSNAHFAHPLAQHDALDLDITKSETGVAPTGDAAVGTLKRQRLHLKDELYTMANAAK